MRDLCTHHPERDEKTSVRTTIDGSEVELGQCCLECGNDAATYARLRKKELRRLKSLHIVVVGKSYSSYQSAEVFVNDERYSTDVDGGYGEYYRQMGLELLVRRGILPEAYHTNGNSFGAHSWREAVGSISHTCATVGSYKDLL